MLDGILIGAGDLRFLSWAMVGAAMLFVPLLFVVGSIGWLWAALGALQVGRMVALGWRWLTPRWQRLGVELRTPS